MVAKRGAKLAPTVMETKQILKGVFIMNNNGKFNVGLYFFALFAGLGSGLLFSKSQYCKGQGDAYSDIANQLDKAINASKAVLDNSNKEEA